MWQSSPFISPVVNKLPNRENAVEHCKKAIEKYGKAKEDMKRSAEALLGFMNE
jgi:hypothetical protein